MAQVKKLGPFGTLVLSSIFIILGIGILIFIFTKNRLIEASKNWPKTKGKIISSELDSWSEKR